MGNKDYLNVPVTGPLNTSDPSTSLDPGSLLRAYDQAHRWIGPRRCGKLSTWHGRAPSGTTAFSGSNPDFGLDGTNNYVKGSLSREQVSLGTKWTLDVAIHAYAARSTSNNVQVFQWTNGTVNLIEFGFHGASTPSVPNKAYCTVKTTDSAGTVTGTFTVTGGTVPFAAQSTLVSGGAMVRYIARIIRDGANLYLLDSTGTSATSTALAEGDPHIASSGSWYYGRDTALGANTTFQGLVLRALLRDFAAPSTIFPTAIEHVYPRAKNVRFFGTSTLLSGSTHAPDLSSYGSHGALTGGSGTVTVGDNHYPLAKVVQGMGSFTDRDGSIMSMAMVGGCIFKMKNR